MKYIEAPLTSSMLPYLAPRLCQLPRAPGLVYRAPRLSHRAITTTTRARLHVDAFVNMLGEEETSWGLSHKGLLWHGDRHKTYIKPFRENVATTIGLYFDGIAGTLTYYKDGQCLGVAFSGLQEVTEPLYPIVCRYEHSHRICQLY